MKTIHFQGTTGRSHILINERLEHLTRYMPAERAVIVTDRTVETCLAEKFPSLETIRVGTGEANKTLRSVEAVYGRLIQMEADRSTFLVGIGGGIVCDITGFVASTYMRGVRFGYVATTLLAQVDASVGGKSGVNFGGYKNMVGVFNQPEFVICDLSLLKTLSQKEISSGFAEIIKHAAIADVGLFSFLEDHQKSALNMETEILEKLIYASVKIKAAVVEQDEKEKGERRKLNFGHTFGHALEKATGVSHGEAVSLGMVIAAEISVKKGLLTADEHAKLKHLLEGYRLPVRPRLDKAVIWDAMQRDKKRESNRMNLVLLNGLGRAVVESMPLAEMKGYLERP